MVKYDMKRKEVIISDFAAAVKEKERLSNLCTRNYWEVVAYETAKISGNGIIASPKTMPKPVTLNPGLDGWYKIYVCMACERGSNHVELKLSNDEFARVVEPGNIVPYIQWNDFEKIEESYWKAADMTGQSITIAKPDDRSSYTASLMWIRFEPMDDKEVDEYLVKLEDTSAKTMYAHMDEDFTYLDLPDFENPKDYCRPLYHMKDSDVGIVAQEVSNDLSDMDSVNPEAYVDRTGRGEEIWGIGRMEQFKNLYNKREVILKEQIAYAHKHNLQFFAVHRMAISSFAFPLGGAWERIPFVEEHPEFYCTTRNGKKVSFLSYAYKEVRNYMIEQFKKIVQYGVDGVTLVFTRGICVLFEQPVIDRFNAKYGDSIDLRRLPNDDPRIVEIKSDIMTDFMRELRRTLDGVTNDGKGSRVKIYIAAYYSAEESKMDGVDVERFAREGLIDGVIQSNMTVCEETDDVLDRDGLIDLAKYSKKAETEYIIKRVFDNKQLERKVQGLEAYNRIATRYSIKLYSEIQWENTVEPEEYMETARTIYENSVGGIALWDCYPCRVNRLPEWYCTSQLGSMEHIDRLTNHMDDYRKIHKVLSYNGLDISLYHPAWRG